MERKLLCRRICVGDSPKAKSRDCLALWVALPRIPGRNWEDLGPWPLVGTPGRESLIPQNPQPPPPPPQAGSSQNVDAKPGFWPSFRDFGQRASCWRVRLGAFHPQKKDWTLLILKVSKSNAHRARKETKQVEGEVATVACRGACPQARGRAGRVSPHWQRSLSLPDPASFGRSWKSKCLCKISFKRCC